MSESSSTEGHKAGKRAAGGGGGGRKEKRQAGPYSVASYGDRSVVLVDSSTGSSWTLESEGGGAVWRPVEFRGGAAKAPRKAGKAGSATP